eukprot:scaffold303375_cov15-Tisochrysis_lutea.AAC.1
MHYPHTQPGSDESGSDPVLCDFHSHCCHRPFLLSSCFSPCLCGLPSDHQAALAKELGGHGRAEWQAIHDITEEKTPSILEAKTGGMEEEEVQP